MTPLRRFAASPQGDNTSGPAKPVPRCFWIKPFRSKETP